MSTCFVNKSKTEKTEVHTFLGFWQHLHKETFVSWGDRTVFRYSQV